MTPATIIAAIAAAQAIIDTLITGAQADAGYSDADKARILAAADAEDREWDAMVAKARARLGGQ